MEDKRENERDTHNKLIPLDIKIINAIKSVCKIITNENEETGFLIKLKKDNEDFNCLMTNEHLITKEMINLKSKIIFYYDMETKIKEIILNKNERYIKEYQSQNLDITIIEIIKEDNIKEKFFLLPYVEDNLENKSIYIIQYPQGKLSYSEGKIQKINKNEIEHDANTKHGSSGSPIFLENTKFVVGIHKQGDREESINYGDLIYPIIIDLKPQLNYKNGNYYKGDIINGKAYGKGILYYKNGKIRYEGDFINDKFEGNGKYYYENGEYYIGQFKNGKAHGKGILYYKNEKIKYEGDFINGKFEGFGNYYYENGNYYKGEEKKW